MDIRQLLTFSNNKHKKIVSIRNYGYRVIIFINN